MVMENLTNKFRKPCILDLKVGTRQYGDDVSDNKRKLHLERCAHSTSHTLGVRICGMQVSHTHIVNMLTSANCVGVTEVCIECLPVLPPFLLPSLPPPLLSSLSFPPSLHPLSLPPSLPSLLPPSRQVYNAATDEYTFCDKYFGRDVPEEGFRASLRGFLFNGVKYRLDILPELIKMLEELRDVIQRQNSYRFYSSSLLIMYDGKGGGVRSDTPLTDRTHVGKRFEHLRPTAEDGVTHLRGSSEIDMTSNGSLDVGGKLDGLEKRTDVGGLDKLSLDHRENGRIDLQSARRFVDVRMIDFAHTTHSGYVNDHVKYTGPDEGYIVGLNTLIAIFSELSQDCLSGEGL